MEVNTAGYNEFLSLIKAMVLGDAKSIEVFADGLGISAPHLYQKLDPNYPDARLTAREAFILMINCEGIGPILLLCGKRGLRADKTDLAVPDKPTLAEELLDNAGAYARYQDVMADPNASEEDATRARMELDAELDQDLVAFCKCRVKGHTYRPGEPMQTTHVPMGKKGARQ
jgi:hypothetical protein